MLSQRICVIVFSEFIGVQAKLETLSSHMNVQFNYVKLYMAKFKDFWLFFFDIQSVKCGKKLSEVNYQRSLIASSGRLFLSEYLALFS